MVHLHLDVGLGGKVRNSMPGIIVDQRRILYDVLESSVIMESAEIDVE